MSATLLKGGDLAKVRKADLKAEVNTFQQTHNITPTLAILRVGDDGAAAGYARAIERNCKSVDIGFHMQELPADADQATVTTALRRLNTDPAIHGIMMLEPLPKQIDATALLPDLQQDADSNTQYSGGCAICRDKS